MIVSLALANSAKIEIPATVAFQYIMHESSMICFHESCTLYLHELIKMMKSDPQCPSRLIRVSDEEFLPMALTDDYIIPPSQLEMIRAYEFFMNYRIVN